MAILLIIQQRLLLIKIQYVLEDDYVYKFFSANTLHRFNESLTVDKMVKAYMDIYQL